MYDFLLVTNSNLRPILHCFGATFRPKLQIFHISLSLSALARGDPFQIYGKALQILKLVFQTTDGEDFVILCCTIFDRFTRVTDKQTDRQTDRQTNRTGMAKTYYSSSCCRA